MACEIPHFVLFYSKGGDGKIFLTGHEDNANVVAAWFTSPEAANAGWRQVSMLEAVSRAERGFPSVLVWNNPAGIGHVGWVIPSDSAGCRIAQAGGSNFFDDDYRKGFGNAAVIFYTHD